MCGAIIAGVPDMQQVVIATTSKLLSIRGPLQTAHLLFVTSQYSSDMLPLPT